MRHHPSSSRGGGGSSSLSPSSPSPSLGSSSSEGPPSSTAGAGGVELRRAGGGGGGDRSGHQQGASNSGSSRGARDGVSKSTVASVVLGGHGADEVESVPLLGGERIVAVFNDLTYLCPYSVPGAMKGSLAVTNYKLFFRAVYRDCPLVLDVPLGFVSRVEKVGGQRTSGENAYGLEIYCKDIRSLRFALSKSVQEGHSSRKDIFETVRQYVEKVNILFPLTYGTSFQLRQYSFPLSWDSQLFAFHFRDRYPGGVDGWSVYDPVAELRRQGLPNESWKISRANEGYELCDTYPQVLGIPKMVSDDDVRESAKFRSKVGRGRFAGRTFRCLCPPPPFSFRAASPF